MKFTSKDIEGLKQLHDKVCPVADDQEQLETNLNKEGYHKEKVITDYGKRVTELYKMTKKELNKIVANKCGLHESAITKSQLRQPKRWLVLSILRMEEQQYDKDGMIKRIPQADISTSWIHK